MASKPLLRTLRGWRRKYPGKRVEFKRTMLKETTWSYIPSSSGLGKGRSRRDGYTSVPSLGTRYGPAGPALARIR
jgi:hypothetical protein